MKCSLCNRNEANQTGAHIFPAWMIASAFDEFGRSRGYEIIYAIRPFNFKVPYFGNSVQPEKISEQIGRDLTDSEIQEQENFMITNNLWCKDCEKRFKILEDYFLENVDRKIVDFSKCNDIGIYELEKANPYLIRLFFYTLFFRASVSGLMSFRLHEKTLIKLRYFLNYYVKDDAISTIKFIDTSTYKDQILKYPIRCFKLESDPTESKGWVFVSNKHSKPYCFIINDYIIQFYGKGNRANFRPESFFGISSIITRMPKVRNYKENIFIIGLFNLRLSNIVIRRYVDYMAKKEIEYFSKLFRTLFNWKFKHFPDELITKIFIKELIDNDLPKGTKYNKENFVKAMNRTLSILNQLQLTQSY